MLFCTVNAHSHNQLYNHNNLIECFGETFPQNRPQLPLITADIMRGFWPLKSYARQINTHKCSTQVKSVPLLLMIQMTVDTGSCHWTRLEITQYEARPCMSAKHTRYSLVSSSGFTEASFIPHIHKQVLIRSLSCNNFVVNTDTQL